MPIRWQAIVPRRTLTSAKQRHLAGQLRGLMLEFVTDGQKYLSNYPPPPADSGYRRTRTLGRSWQHRVAATSNEIVGIVGSQGQIAPYNIYVQGDRQTMQHKRSGWPTPQDFLTKELPTFQRRVGAAFDALV